MTTLSQLPFTGHTVLVTGNVAGFSRDEAKATIVRLGGIAAPGVTAKVTLVVPGEGAGVSKMSKARMLGTPILTPEEFTALAADPHGWDTSPLGTPFAVWETANEPTPEPRPVIDLTHAVGKGVVHVPVDGGFERQVRLGCQCGHKWMRDQLNGNDMCPQPAQPTLVGPWTLRTL